MALQGRNKQGDVFKRGPSITLYANKEIWNKHKCLLVMMMTKIWIFGCGGLYLDGKSGVWRDQLL